MDPSCYVKLRVGTLVAGQSSTSTLTPSPSSIGIQTGCSGNEPLDAQERRLLAGVGVRMLIVGDCQLARRYREWPLAQFICPVPKWQSIWAGGEANNHAITDLFDIERVDDSHH